MVVPGTRKAPEAFASFAPTERAVILFCKRDDQILLIHKKRGLGTGKINGPGGRIEPGESAADAAIRETDEEVGVTVYDTTPVATLRFRFTDGYHLEVYVFTSERFSGEPIETDEALPFWCHVDEIPYHRMWADDALWLPHVLAERYVDGWFDFDDDTMLGSHVAVDPDSR